MLEFLRTSEVELWTVLVTCLNGQVGKKVIVEPCSGNERILYNRVNAPMDTP